ncbi:MAG: single-stranded DNA-binding protein [Candidatus Komeilibacteria bacterium CG10_big_fil_rev_8_21_14_0_10_41_13]|uniref:Single-stranded DNA-binding protein n=1 Tax=Candidatus Komeilibacteria bacterium CG10_big_fil_rev_8_21_14_0_10_41_13 TaxID=1974476 RepID=A0A2M6WCG3_9BACT|nr:MAG: single-stranded DNA-binding protein [Candidatus Komeilibacteria bacterium CG10_big_fil_rev_8_21_14_0_10_41_13]
MDLNKVMIIGNVTNNPELKTTPSGLPVVSFGVATNLTWKDQSGNKQEKAEFHNVVAWRRLAETINQYLKKGSKVYIEGRLQTRSWEDQNNVKKYKTEIIADNMIMLDRAPSSNGGYQSRQTQEPKEQADNQSQISSSGNNNSEEEINIEDIPF